MKRKIGKIHENINLMYNRGNLDIVKDPTWF